MAFLSSKSNIRGSMKLVLFKFMFIKLRCFVFPDMSTNRCRLVRNKGRRITGDYLIVTVINHCIQTAFNLEKNALSRAQTYTCTTYLALLLIKTSLKDKIKVFQTPARRNLEEDRARSSIPLKDP